MDRRRRWVRSGRDDGIEGRRRWDGDEKRRRRMIVVVVLMVVVTFIWLDGME